MLGKLRLGCPVWACEHWKGGLFTPRATRPEWLSQYSSVFATVEGNSTFYALPNVATAVRWAKSVGPDFRFALKVPRAISHEARLVHAEAALERFLEIAEVLQSHQCLGPSFLQLPPDFSPNERRELESFLRALPVHLCWAVELRHAAWFDQGTEESWLDDLLASLEIDKVIFDSRPLYSLPPSDEHERVAQQRKPKTPVRMTVTARHPFLRLIGRNRVDEVQAWIDHWAPTVAQWLINGLEPYVFTHTPDDAHAPQLARRFHTAVSRVLESLPPMPAWPGEVAASAQEVQMRLFD